MAKRPKPPAAPPLPAPPVVAPQPTRSRWADVFAVDARSLGAFRIGLGAWLLLDLLVRSFDLTAFYTDFGVMPRMARIEFYDLTPGSDRRYWLSLFMMTGEPWVVRGLFAAGAVAYAALAVGYRTRLATVASFVCICSFQSRVPPVCDSGDTLVRVLLFWGMFLPLGGRFSLDVVRGYTPAVPDRLCNVATLGLLSQVCWMYLFSAAGKMDAVWHTDFTALYYTLSLECFATPLGRALVGQSWLTKPLTFATFWLEWLGPLVLLVPLRTPWLRLAVAVAFCGFHIGTALTLHIGLFPLAGLICWVPFLPGVVWRWVPRWKAASIAGPPVRLGWVTTVFVAVMWGYLLLWNLREVNPWWLNVMPRWATIPARVLRVDQDWGMFAPKPMEVDGWLIMQGRLADGRVVNLWEPGAPLPTDKPADVAATFHNYRWRKYLVNLRENEYATLRQDLAIWLQRRWEEEHPGGPKVVACELALMATPTPPPGAPAPPTERRVLFTGRDPENK